MVSIFIFSVLFILCRHKFDLIYQKNKQTGRGQIRRGHILRGRGFEFEKLK